MPIRVVVTDHGFPDLQAERETLDAIGAEIAEFQCRTPEEVIACTLKADAVLTQWAPITEEVINRMDRCKVIVRYGIGVDNVDLEAAGRKGIPVVNIPDYAFGEVADHTMALLLSSIRKIPQVFQQIRSGIWETNPTRPMYSLGGRTLGLAGFGNIAQKVAVRAKAFGMRVIAYDPYVPTETFDAHQVESAGWERLLSESDYVSVHLPLTEQTRRLFDRSAFALMKNEAFLVNTSRGGVIHTGDLIEALRDGRLAGAGLDVLEEEPVEAGSPLLTLPNVILTSHCAWYTEDSLARLKQFAAAEIVRVFSGEQPKHIVNRKWLADH